MCQNVARMHCWLWLEVQCWLAVFCWWRPICFRASLFPVIGHGNETVSPHCERIDLCVSSSRSLSRSISLSLSFFLIFPLISIYHFIYLSQLLPFYWLLYDFSCSVSHFQPQLSNLSSMTIKWPFCDRFRLSVSLPSLPSFFLLFSRSFWLSLTAFHFFCFSLVGWVAFPSSDTPSPNPGTFEMVLSQAFYFVHFTLIC